MAANGTEIEYDVDEVIVIDESNLEQLNFFTSTEIVPDGLITADDILQSTGIELSEVRVPLLKFVNEDDIGMVEALDSNETTADKVPPIYICPVCSKKYKHQISYVKHVSQCDLQKNDTVTNKAHKLADDNSTSTSKLANGKFFLEEVKFITTHNSPRAVEVY